MARPKTQPKEIHNPENTKELVERTTRSRQNIETSSCGIKCKPRLPEPMPNPEGHLLETVIMEEKYSYDIQNRVIKQDGNFLARFSDKDAHRVGKELNRLDRRINEYERTIAKIRKILKS